MCDHNPPCPLASDDDCVAARLIVTHPEQGWSLLCNGVVAFHDGGLLVPIKQATSERSPEATPLRIRQLT